jgi:hypothetical protein
MYPNNVSLADDLKQAHAQSWQTLAAAGDFFTGAERVGFVRCAREALTCSLCRHKKESLSPNTPSSVDNESHDGDSQLNATIVDMIHRIRTDPGRLTKSWFDDVTKEISKKQYVEIVSVVTSSVIIDTLHNALGLGLPTLPIPISGRPRRQFNDQAVEGGAWVPMLAGSSAMTDTGMPAIPNIRRALGLVPSAVDLFFTTFRPHYALRDIDLTINQAQAEFVAARVSAINECFY